MFDRCSLVLYVFWFLSACNSTPEMPEAKEAFVEGQTAHYDSLLASLDSFNFAWAPQPPAPHVGQDSVLVTVLVRVRNQSQRRRLLEVSSLKLQASGENGSIPESYWPSSSPSLGRTPALTTGQLAYREESLAWLTFRIPKELIPDGIYWEPNPFTHLLVPFPPGHGRGGGVRVFGNVTGLNDTPVNGVRIVIAPVFPLDPDDGNPFCPGGVGTSAEDITDESGHFSIDLIVGAADIRPICIDLLAFPPPGSALQEIHIGGQTVRLGGDAPHEELPQIHIDVHLQ